MQTLKRAKMTDRQECQTDRKTHKSFKWTEFSHQNGGQDYRHKDTRIKTKKDTHIQKQKQKEKKTDTDIST